MKLLPSTLTISILLALMPAVADDGALLKKNVSKTPELETEHAVFRMLPVYVPAQSSDGTLLTEGIEYYDADGGLEDTREYVRPLISYYTDGHVDYIDEEGYGGFPGHGERDAWAAVSLDDGETWVRSNLSQSADDSSFKVKLGGRKKIAYPGDVGRSFMSSDGNKVLAVWVSRFCGSGNPAYAMSEEEQALLAPYLTTSGIVPAEEVCTDDNLATPCTYLEDSFAVAGSQGSSDLADEGLPLIGELPYACLWAARGSIQPPAAEGEPSIFTWFKAERLTSGVRDANRPEAACVKGAGCVVTWQEDPGGIRPGEGEGPGEGWSGAIAHHKTDTWYSYIDWDDFDLVADHNLDTVLYGTFYNSTGILADWLALYDQGSPQAAVPMSIPVRITDNAMCTEMLELDLNLESKPYCYIDYDSNGTADFCATTVTVNEETPEGTMTLEMCVTEDGRLMRGNTASTRARVRLHGYSSLGIYDPADPDTSPIDSAWFSTSYEENKGLGECDDVDETKLDMGKNVWYHTFDMFHPELVSQGLMLNQPAIYPDDFSDTLGTLTQDDSYGYNFYLITEDPIYEVQTDLESTLYQTEISRRPSPITQDWYTAGSSGAVAFQLWKQGVIRRGGPADIMGRRFVLPDGFDATMDNPYGYANMICDTWAFADGTNPRYVKGLCVSPATNISANTIIEGETCSDAETCLGVFPFNDYFDDLEGGTQIPKIYVWEQFGPGYGEAAPDNTNLDDTTWANPYDVAKGHRGFLLGDMLMTMYAWSPNWMANTVGHDNYNLYNRRSFDGGQTWSTTPGGLEGNGTTTCEWMGPAGSATEYSVCTSYAAGQFEQARNVSQLVGTNVTILDPRYSPATPSITEASVSTGSLPDGFIAAGYDDDLRDPSRYFMVYETGDNTTVALGEAEPLDLFYSRAIDYGDNYLVWQDEANTDCLPSAENADLAGFCNEFDALEGKAESESGEASITTNPGGTFFYALWNQVDFDDDDASDAWFRRVMFIDEYVPGDGTSEPPPDPEPCTDADGDGYCADEAPFDCDDDDASINPGASDKKGRHADGIDNDCDGIIDG